jgi:hypothetical protein
MTAVVRYHCIGEAIPQPQNSTFVEFRIQNFSIQNSLLALLATAMPQPRSSAPVDSPLCDSPLLVLAKAIPHPQNSTQAEIHGFSGRDSLMAQPQN